MSDFYHLAAIDIGTNSFHLVLASVASGGVYKIISRDKEAVRLGEGAGDMKRISDEATERAIAALRRFKDTIGNNQIPIRAIATSAVREAENRDDFLHTIAVATGINIEVVSGQEEARLIYLGVLQALPIYERKALIIDIGGGSTETVIGQEGNLLHVNSAKLGAIRLSRLFFSETKTSEKSIQACREHISGEWAHVFRQLSQAKYDTAIATSGTAENLFAMAMVARGESHLLPVPNSTVITDEELFIAVEKLIAADTVKKRSGLTGLDAKRADIILGGALILEQFVEKLGIKHLTFSSNALREGILVDSYHKAKNISRFHHLSRLRYESIMRLCKLYSVNLPHAQCVRDIAVQIFDALQPVTGFGDTERELLEAAAFLHDVGYIISSDQHHKHSYYIITNSTLFGFTVNEMEIIANIARYHRKSHPKNKHENFKKIKPRERVLVEVLAGILRIAEGLDRRQEQLVASVEVSITHKTLKITLATSSDKLPDIELWGAERRKQLLEERLRRTISFAVKKSK